MVAITVALVVVVLALVALVLIVLVLMREVMGLRSRVSAVVSLVTTAPLQALLDSPLPEPLRNHVTDHATRHPDERVLGLVVAESGCSACLAYLRQLAKVVRQRQLSSTALLIVVRTPDGLDLATAIARETGGSVVLDKDGSMVAAASVEATPTVLVVRAGDGHLLDYSQGGGVEWLAERMSEGAATRAVRPRTTAVRLPAAVSQHGPA
jgi:hypothetical protein